MDPLSQWFMRKFTPQYITASDVIITVSNSTKSDLMRLYHCPESKITVTHNAPSDIYKPLGEDEISNFKIRNTDGNDFFLFVGSIHPRKNVFNLLKAFEQFKTEYQSAMKLVLIGRMAWQYEPEKEFLQQMKYRLDVILIPHSSPEIIAQWMASSTALILVSKYEGFGVPLVEAMACHVPIICSNISSLPEIAGDAALIIDPENHREIANALHRISEDKALRKQLIANGEIRVKTFTWQHASEIVWDAVENLLN
jgi:glycosyltransferase involved in cell wall biosynthesis